MNHPELSIVLPCYNESAGLEALLARFEASGKDAPFELILVDNGSTDSTPRVLQELLPKFPFARSIRVEKNQGYGHGILSGLHAAKAEVLAWSHADLQTDPADIFRAWQVYRQSANPSRTLVKGRRRGRAWREKVVSLGMQTVATLLLRTRLEEINAQPKLFRRELLAMMKNPPLDLNLDLFLLYTARQCGWQIVSIDVHFPPRQHGTSSWAATSRSRIRTIARSIRYMWRLSVEQPSRGPVSIDASPGESSNRAA